jgi:hypothetical protein
LPRLVGIEHSVVLELGTGPDRHLIRSVPDQTHESHLTREEVTSAVHYVRFPCTPQDVVAFRTGPVVLLVDHAEYPDGRPGTELSETTRHELARDLAGE